MGGNGVQATCGGCGGVMGGGDRFCPTCGRVATPPHPPVGQVGAAWVHSDSPTVTPNLASGGYHPTAPLTSAPVPQGQPAPAPVPTLQPAPARSGWRGPVVATVVVGVVLALAAAALTVVLLGHGSSQPAATRAVTTHGSLSPQQPASDHPFAGAQGKQGAEQQGAGAGQSASGDSGVGSQAPPVSSGPSSAERAEGSKIAALLADDASDRGAVVAATQAVGNCTADPSDEAGNVQGAVVARQNDLSTLQGLSVADLPNGATMQADLAQAMEASDQADGDYEQWMSDIEGDPCPYPTTTDSNFQAATSASAQATAAKTAFTALWNPVAAQLGLTQYDQSQI